MTEREDLERGVMESKIRQQFAEIQAYLDGLTAQILVAKKTKNVAEVIYFTALAGWITSSFFGETIHSLGTTVFIIALAYDQYRLTDIVRLKSRFLGAIDMLRILGFVPPHDEGGSKKRKKRRTPKELVDLVKSWAIKKQKSRDEVFAPA